MTARTLALTALLLALLAAPASAADFFVNSTTDDGNGVCSDGTCTLRDAVLQAGQADRIILPAGAYELTEGQLELNGDTIGGFDARTTSIQGDGDARAIYAGGGANLISDVTIMAGGRNSQPLTAMGGGVLVRNASLTLLHVTVRQNEAAQGGGLANLGGTLNVMRSTIFDNLATVATGTGQGGGIFSAGTTTVRNSTVSGNRATAAEGEGRGGAVYVNGGAFSAQSTTIANNQATFGSAIAAPFPANTTVGLSHTIVENNLGLAPCANVLVQGGPNVSDTSSCGSTAADPGLGPLENNGGQTDTHPITASLSAHNTGTICEPSDQRGVARFGACDIGAFELVPDPPPGPPVLWVVTDVVNDNGGTLTPAQVSVAVNGVAQPGSATGEMYLPPNGGSTVAAAASGYTTTISGHCAGGEVILGNGDARVCTVRLDDIGDSQPPPGGGGGGNEQPPPPEPPEAGETVNATPSGTVKVKLPGSNRFVDLAEAQLLPVGTIVDTLEGRVTLLAAGGQTATFFGGIFKIGQGKGARPLTTLTLVEKLTCPKAGKAVAAAKKKKRRLWGDGSGKFRTKGKHSAATVVGTRWLVEDRCTSTLTRVVEGRVKVRDFAKKKTVTVRAGKKYVARAKRR